VDRAQRALLPQAIPASDISLDSFARFYNCERALTRTTGQEAKHRPASPGVRSISNVMRRPDVSPPLRDWTVWACPISGCPLSLGVVLACRIPL